MSHSKPVLRRGLHLLLVTSLTLIGLLAIPVQKSEAREPTQNRFLSAAEWQLQYLAFTESDADGQGEDLLARSTVLQINPDLSVAIPLLNSYVAALLANGNAIWKDSDIFDGNASFELNGCNQSTFTIDNTGFEIIDLYVNIPGPGCVDIIRNMDMPIEVSNSDWSAALKKRFRWINSRTIQRVDGKDGSFVNTAAEFPSRFFRVAEANTNGQDYLDVRSDTAGEFFRDPSGNGNLESQGESEIIDVAKRSDPAVLDANGNVVVNDAPAETEEDNSCESKSGVLGWIMCPIVNTLDDALNWVDSQVQSLLEIDEEKYTNDELKQAWSTIRNVAYIILIPIMLVMVLGTALGFEVFSAYTIKRALPRMVIAVIFITLSWYICTFLITFFNVVGGGILGIVTSPFKDLVPASCQDGNLNLSCLFDVPQSDGLGGGVLLAILNMAQYAVVFIGTIALLIFFGGGLLFAIVAGFLVLVARQMFVIALLLLSPLAILAWIFPGNDRLWKGWWGVFSKLLIMFPLIMLLIAVGRVFALIVNISGGAGAEGAVINPIMKLIAYILPYAAIPFTFKFAGGVFANLAGIVNDKNRGFSGRAKQLRNLGLKKFDESARSHKSLLGNTSFGGAYRRVASGGRKGSLSMTRRGRSRWVQAEMENREKTADKMNEEGGGRAFNDDDASDLLIESGMTRPEFIRRYSQMLAERHAVRDDDGNITSIQPAETYARDAADALNRSELAVGARAGSSGMRVAAQKFRTAMTNTAYAPGAAGLDDLAADLQALQRDGLITAVDAAGWMKSNRGRSDFNANGFVDTINFAAGHTPTGEAVTGRDQLRGAFNGADPREIMGGHQRAVEAFAEQAEIEFRAAVASGDTTQIDKRAADLANVHSILSSFSPKKADLWADRVYSQGARLEGVRPDPVTGAAVTRELTIREFLDEARSDSALHSAFHDRSREYGSAQQAMGAGAAAESARPPEPPPAH